MPLNAISDSPQSGRALRIAFHTKEINAFRLPGQPSETGRAASITAWQNSPMSVGDGARSLGGAISEIGRRSLAGFGAGAGSGRVRWAGSLRGARCVGGEGASSVSF